MYTLSICSLIKLDFVPLTMYSKKALFIFLCSLILTSFFFLFSFTYICCEEDP